MTRSRGGIERNDGVSPNQNGAPGRSDPRGAFSSTSLRDSQRGGRRNRPGHASDTARVGRIDRSVERSTCSRRWDRQIRASSYAQRAQLNQEPRSESGVVCVGSGTPGPPAWLARPPPRVAALARAAGRGDGGPACGTGAAA
jgi:hypothetical protein